MTFPRFRFVEVFFFHKCCDTTIANLLVNMQGNLLLFSGTWRSLALKIACDPGQCHTAGMPASRTGGWAVRILHAGDVGTINRVPQPKSVRILVFRLYDSMILYYII